jgi:2-polyprenyl-6-methoxyphenol hydroxylase-like FAD-dependent oxidoreductase
MLATWMARCGIDARIVDKRGTKIYAGQADGLQLRSLEIFDSFGFADRAVKEANHMIEVCGFCLDKLQHSMGPGAKLHGWKS